MDTEDRQKLERILKLAEENNEYIRKVRSSQKTSQMIKAIYWVVILVFVLGGFYYVQPYLKTLGSLYQKTNGASLSLPDADQLKELIDQFKQQ